MADKQETKTVRLRNINSGAIVSVVAEKVDRLGSEWEPAGSAAAKKAAAKATSSDDK